MADPIPGTTAVTDQRKRPRGVLPRNAQAWLMVGLALGILAIIVFTGRSEPPERPRPATSAQPLSPDADRLRSYQERLRLLDAQARQQLAEPATEADPQPPQDGVPAPTDPLDAEKKRREYESLFARVVVARATDNGPSFGRSMGWPNTPVPAGAPSVSGLDAITEAVLRASAQQPAAISGRPTPAAASTPSEVETPSPATTPTAPQHRLAEGTLIPTLLTHQLDSTAQAPVNCLVTSPVYAPDRQHVLIPAGARVLGTTKPVQALGESRVAVSFHRLLMPNGTSYSLDRFVGLNAIGDAGLRGHVNQHYVSTFGAAAAVGLLTGLSQALGTVGLGHSDGDRTIVLAGGTSETTQATGRVLDRLLNRAPTVTIPPGHRVYVYLTSDLDLPPYDDRFAARPTHLHTREGVR